MKQNVLRKISCPYVILMLHVIKTSLGKSSGTKEKHSKATDVALSAWQSVDSLKMLSPQVWDFEPPSSLVFTRVCQSENEILQTFDHQYFNHFVSVAIPDASQVPKELVDSCLEDSEYYRISRIFGADLLKKSFVECFVRKGNLTAFSVSNFSEEDRVALTPCGKLIFSLTKNTYQSIGIEGVFTKHSRSSLRKYFLVVDLLSDTNEEKKICELLEKRLMSLIHLCFDLVLAWEPHDPNICPSSIAQYFHQKNYKVKTCKIAYNQRFEYNVSVPDFNAETDLSDFVEWLGVFGLDCEISSKEYISSIKYPEKQIVLGQVIYLTFVGLITLKRLQTFLSKVRTYAETKTSSMWISTVIQAFQDSIINIKNQKLFLSDGDQLKTVIFSNKQPPVVYSFKDIKK